MNRPVAADRRCEPLLSGAFAIDAGHPALAGNFPGHPIAPLVLVFECSVDRAAIVRGALILEPPA